MQKSPDTRDINTTVWLPAALVAAGIVCADRLTKWYFFRHLEEGVTPLFRGVLDLVVHMNFGIVANVPLPKSVTIFLTLIIVILLCLGIRKAEKERRVYEALALSCILGGAFGNLYDRVVQKYVFDWILLFERSAINLADIAIVAGTLWYISLKQKTRSPETEGR